MFCEKSGSRPSLIFDHTHLKTKTDFSFLYDIFSFNMDMLENVYESNSDDSQHGDNKELESNVVSIIAEEEEQQKKKHLRKTLQLMRSAVDQFTRHKREHYPWAKLMILKKRMECFNRDKDLINIYLNEDEKICNFRQYDEIAKAIADLSIRLHEESLVIGKQVDESFIDLKKDFCIGSKSFGEITSVEEITGFKQEMITKLTPLGLELSKENVVSSFSSKEICKQNLADKKEKVNEKLSVGKRALVDSTSGTIGKKKSPVVKGGSNSAIEKEMDVAVGEIDNSTMFDSKNNLFSVKKSVAEFKSSLSEMIEKSQKNNIHNKVNEDIHTETIMGNKTCENCLKLNGAAKLLCWNCEIRF
jgi:hypothetical protein